MNKSFALIALIALTACTTPKTVMKNPKTGQIATCGGSSTGSFAGGAIGYHIQKGNDADCVADYTAEGFKTIKVEEY